MSKRFTDTEKWSHAWFRKLSPKYKCAWSYLLDKCDYAGIWLEDFEAMSFNIGEPIEAGEFEKVFSGKVKKIDSDKYLIEAFIDFQYGELNPNNKVHKSVIKKLEKNHAPSPVRTSSVQGAKETSTSKEEVKVKEEEKEEEKEKEEAKHLLAFWNGKQIINHKESDELISEIVAALKKSKRKPEEVLQAIKNYASVVNSDQHFFNYKWTLPIFITRPNAKQFYGEAFIPENYLIKKPGGMSFDQVKNQMQNNPYRNAEVV
jgi:ribosomal protein L12E/L44/L45/RPP1/RPP2